MNAICDRANGNLCRWHAIKIFPHFTAHFAVKFRNSIDALRQSKRQDSHAECLFHIARFDAAEICNLQRRQATARHHAGEFLNDHFWVVTIMPCGDWRMRCEDGRSAHRVKGILNRLARRVNIKCALHGSECSVTFIEMQDADALTKCFQCKHAADSKKNLLSQSKQRFAFVQTLSQSTIFRSVCFQIGVEQIERNSPNPHTPNARRHKPRADWTCDCAVRVFEPPSIEVVLWIEHLRRTITRQLLNVITVSICQTNGDERNT